MASTKMKNGHPMKIIDPLILNVVVVVCSLIQHMRHLLSVPGMGSCVVIALTRIAHFRRRIALKISASHGWYHSFRSHWWAVKYLESSTWFKQRGTYRSEFGFWRRSDHQLSYINLHTRKMQIQIWIRDSKFVSVNFSVISLWKALPQRPLHGSSGNGIDLQ